MAESNVEPEHEWSDRALDTAEDTLVAMETLLATLRAFEDVLRQQEISVASSTEYCDNFCQALMHYAGSRNSIEHGLPLLEVYCLSINCFGAARSHLTAESDRVALVLKRLALSCFELLLSVPENEIPYEAWVQFHHSVQIAHDTLLQYGSTDLQALLQITGEGGAWNNPVLTSLLTGQHTNPEEVDAYISLEGEGFMEMRVKHLEKMGEVAKAVVLAKSCTECSCISNQATFRQTYVSLLCHLLPNEEAIMEISRLDCKDVLEITCNLETEGEENTAFILCTTYLTQQLQQQSLYSSWELILLWSKLQRRIDPSLTSLLERCLQLGAIAKTVHHLLYLVRVIQAEAEDLGVPTSVELSVKALQLPKQDDSETRISVLKMVSCLLPDDLEVLRACLLTEFLLGPSQEAFGCLEELYLRPDQKYDQENEVIPNSLRCELLLALKAYWPFDPEFWDWKTLKYHCISLLGLMPESEGEDEVALDKQEKNKQYETLGITVKVESEQKKINGVDDCEQDKRHLSSLSKNHEEAETKKHKFCCQICKRSISDTQIIHHSKRHTQNNCHPCPVCLENFKSRKELVPHMKQHIQSDTHVSLSYIKEEDVQRQMDEEDDIEPGEITIDPSLMLYYKSTHDPEVLQHIVEQAKTAKEKHVVDDEYITFEYIDQHFNLQNRDEYQCPGTGCTRIFKHSKYLYVHLKSEHKDDENVKHFHQTRDQREKCIFCRRHFVSAYHHRKHRRVHYGDQPYMCVVMGCGAKFSTSNELVTHKQTHGFQLNYQCELKGCYVTYSDLGQIYHHEAQHFRDAAFTCSNAECRKYYLSKKEFIKHLSTHNITFTEEDFEAQRKAKRKLHKKAMEAAAQLPKSVDAAEIVNGDVLNSSSVSCASSFQASDSKESKATMTLVAVCFDGSKFTCGFEKCGMTFSRARDVQRHLKCAHPEHLKLENRDHKHDKERGSKSKGVKTENEPGGEEQGNDESAAPIQHVEAERKSSTHNKNNDTNTLSLQTKNDALKEILLGLSKLDLNSASPSSSPSETPQSTHESNASQISLHQAIMANPPVVSIKKKPQQLPEDNVIVKSEPDSLTDEERSLESLATAKPYICEITGCGFRTAQSYSLLRHYNNRHGRTVEQAKTLTSLKTTSFKPYVCHLCSKGHRQKHVLRAHYIHIHKLSATLVDKLSSSSVRHEEQHTSHTQDLTNHDVRLRKEEVPKLQRQQEKKNTALISENGQNFDNHSPSEEEADDEAESREEDDKQKGEVEGEDKGSQVRTRRLVAKSNLCYILDKFSKPFHCVAKNCDAAFSTQGGLVRHLQLIHHYNRSQLLLEGDFDGQLSPEVRKEPAKKRPLPNSDEPQPQYKCHFANCNASYHLKSSLARHTRDYHSQPPELIRCKYEGCTKVFSHDDALKKHTLYSHFEYYDSLVVRLQSTHKKSITGCQKKLIVAPQSPQKEEPASTTTQADEPSPKPEVTAQSEEVDEEHVVEKKAPGERKRKRDCFSRFEFRSHEEALQMCQDVQMRRLRVAYPCMVQDCDSVVTYVGSLHRHYRRVHRMRQTDIVTNEENLFFNAEKLEELIQRKSARPTVTGASSPNGVRKMEYQAEPENTGGQSAPMSLHSIKTETQDEDNHNPLCFPEEDGREEPPPVERNGVLVGADEVLYGEPSTGGHTEDSSAATPNGQKPEERVSLEKMKHLLRPITVDLSPPCTLRFTTEEGFQDMSATKESVKMLNGSAPSPSPPVRQPLKRKNELSEQPSNLIDSQSRSSSPHSFDIGSYKPMGFESSFLRFIQETTPGDKNSGQGKRRDSFRHNCSVKENNQLGISHTRSRRTHSPMLKPHVMTGDFTSVQNLKSILDKALAGCGDLAIKQLQYLRPVVVLGRPVCTTTLPDLFPSDTNSKLLLGS